MGLCLPLKIGPHYRRHYTVQYLSSCQREVSWASAKFCSQTKDTLRWCVNFLLRNFNKAAMTIRALCSHTITQCQFSYSKALRRQRVTDGIRPGYFPIILHLQPPCWWWQNKNNPSQNVHNSKISLSALCVKELEKMAKNRVRCRDSMWMTSAPQQATGSKVK